MVGYGESLILFGGNKDILQSFLIIGQIML